MENYHIRFTNGSASRSIVSLQPNIDLAILAGHRLSAAAFDLPWNQVTDRAKWKIIVISNVGERQEEQARGRPFSFNVNTDSTAEPPR
jgi:hypothetical protein